jgi:hypothetical protein
MQLRKGLELRSWMAQVLDNLVVCIRNMFSFLCMSAFNRLVHVRRVRATWRCGKSGVSSELIAGQEVSACRCLWSQPCRELRPSRGAYPGGGSSRID